MEDINIIRDALLSVLPENTHKGFAAKAEAPYLVWDFDNAVAVWSDNHMEFQSPGGTVDLFTRDPDNLTLMHQVQDALDRVCSWSLESIQHEDDTGLTHYEWRWELP